MDANLTLDAGPETKTLVNFLAEVGFQTFPSQSASTVEFLAGPQLPGRVTFAQQSETAVVDFYLYNAVWLTGTAREAAIETLLQLNQVALEGRHFALGLDSRDYVLLTASLNLLPGTNIPETLAYLAGQAGRIQQLIGAVTLQDVEVNVQLAPPEA